MSEFGTRLLWLRDPRLAALAASALPAWLWSIDAARVLWANPTGAAIFGAPTAAVLCARRFDAGQPAAAQVARLAASLAPGAAPRLERLRGFGAGVGRALTCQCRHITLADNTAAVLIVATERAGPDLPLSERVRRLLAGCGEPVAAFAADGSLMHMPSEARASFGAATSLAAIGAQTLAAEALSSGHAAGDATIGPMTLHRIGSEPAPVLLATLGASRAAEPKDAPGVIVATGPEPQDEPAATADAAAQDAEPVVVVEAAPASPHDPVTIVEATETHSESEGTVAAVAEPPHELVTIVETSDPHGELGPVETAEWPVGVEMAPVFPQEFSTNVEPAPEPVGMTQAQSESQPALVAPVAGLPEPRASDPTTFAPAPPTAPELPPPTERRHPLRFVWQIDAENRFTIGSDEFVALIGRGTAAMLARPWHEIAAAQGLDPDGQIERAIATHDTWSGLSATWPVDDMSERLTVELSGLPVFDRERVFRGYRGFGVCRDLARLTELARLRHAAAMAAAAAVAAQTPVDPVPTHSEDAQPPITLPAPETIEAAELAYEEEFPAAATLPTNENVVPFRAVAEVPSLSAVERRAFRELSRRLTERLTAAGVEYHARGAVTSEAEADDDALFAPDPTLTDLADAAKAVSEAGPGTPAADPELDADLFDEPTPATDTRAVFDRFPVGVLIYRLNDLLYANRAFLDWTGHATVEALAEAGGLDSLMVEPGAVAIEEGGRKPFKMASPRDANSPANAQLFLVPWEGDSAFALVTTAFVAEPRPQPIPLTGVPDEIGELNAILEIATDGVVVFARDGRVVSANRRAQALFGHGDEDFAHLVFMDLFAQESLDVALDYLDGLQNGGVASVLHEGREVIGRAREGGTIALFMSMGRVGESGNKFCAVFRDITKWKKAEADLTEAKQLAEKQSSAKSDFLAKISHEIRTPLNAIIGFSEVMMEERFGPVGSDRYRQYLKDIHASGGHLISLINDLLDLSKIEAGKLDLAFSGVALNDLTQQCVAIMQPQANRERIIIRTSLVPKLPQVVADARSVRQIVLNLLSNSIKFTGAGGQVIVSTALTDAGEVVLRVRDTGVGMSEKDLATALEPFRQLATSTRFGSGGTGLGLPLTKALAEANRAAFHIKSTPNAGTLVEITFAANRVLAE
jgi:PAS domain S-box-containing protein